MPPASVADPRTLLSEEAAELLATRPPSAARAFLYLLVPALLAAIAWAAASPLEVLVVARGALALEDGVVVVGAAARGTLGPVHVREGEPVPAGAPLFELAAHEPTELELRARALARVETEAAALPSLEGRARERVAALQDRASALDAAEAKALDAAERAAGEGATTHAAELDKDAALARAAALDARAELARSRAELEQARASVGARLEAARAELEDARRAAGPGSAADGSARAPVAGIVARVAHAPGDAVSPGEPVVALAPDGARLVARVSVPLARAAALRAGETARVRLGSSSAPVVAAGTVTQVHGPVADPELGLVLVATVALEERTLAAAGERRALPAGAPAVVEIVTGRTTPLGWLLGAVR